MSVKHILAVHGVTLPEDNPAIAAAALTGKLLYALMRTCTMNPKHGIAELNETGRFNSICYKQEPGQPINTRDDVYYELSESHTFIIRDAKVVRHAHLRHGEDIALVLFVEKHYQPISQFDSFAHTNRLVRAVFNHYGIPLEHLDYRDPQLTYLLHSGGLVRGLSFVKSYFSEHLEGFLSNNENTTTYSRLGLALLISEYVTGFELCPVKPGTLPEQYSENIHGGTGLCIHDDVLRVYNLTDQNVCDVTAIPLRDVMRDAPIMYRRMYHTPIRGLTKDIPPTNCPYFETIVANKKLLGALTLIEYEDHSNWVTVCERLWEGKVWNGR